MRLQLLIAPPHGILPFDHVYKLKGVIHKWIGQDTEIHDGQSFFTYGQLQGGEWVKDGLRFPNGIVWNLSFWDPNLSKQVIAGILQDPNLFAGLRVIEIRESPAPQFGTQYYFYTDSPVLIRHKQPNGRKEYLLWDHPLADDLLTQSLRRKLTKAGFEGEHLNIEIQFDQAYVQAKARLIQYKQLKHKASACPLWIAGTTEALQFAWLTGLGDLTNSGFGALR